MWISGCLSHPPNLKHSPLYWYFIGFLLHKTVPCRLLDLALMIISALTAMWNSSWLHLYVHFLSSCNLWRGFPPSPILLKRRYLAFYVLYNIKYILLRRSAIIMFKITFYFSCFVQILFKINNMAYVYITENIVILIWFGIFQLLEIQTCFLRNIYATIK